MTIDIGSLTVDDLVKKMEDVNPGNNYLAVYHGGVTILVARHYTAKLVEKGLNKIDNAPARRKKR